MKTTLSFLILLGTLLQAPAALIWYADFSSYNTSGGAVSPVYNSTADDDTFRSTTVSGGAITFQVSGTSVPSFMTGNALFINAVGSGSGSVSARINQNSLDSIGTTGLLIVSYDMLRLSSSNFSVNNIAREGNSNAGSASTSSLASVGNTPLRVTFVVNRTGADITLPGTLGTLATNTSVTYWYDGTNYNIGIKVAADSTGITGFGAGLSASATTNTLSGWYDNFGVWTSTSDKVDGVNVLQLAPGTVPVPEPSSVALLGLGSVVLLFLTCKK